MAQFFSGSYCALRSTFIFLEQSHQDILAKIKLPVILNTLFGDRQILQTLQKPTIYKNALYNMNGQSYNTQYNSPSSCCLVSFGGSSSVPWQRINNNMWESETGMKLIYTNHFSHVHTKQRQFHCGKDIKYSKLRKLFWHSHYSAEFTYELWSLMLIRQVGQLIIPKTIFTG